MVAKIKSGKSLIGALNYNERKVKSGKARLIMASLYPKDMKLLTFEDKLFRLTDLADRNNRTKTNTLHLSLNFDVSEILDSEKLCAIAERYMEKIGFGNQPYLVYQHNDAGHNHIHIVSTNIEANGNRISLHNIGKLKSEPARKEIELEYNLVKAETQHKAMVTDKNIKPLIYGQTDTKRSISNIINHVAQTYKFTSLPELNAVLRQYNILADRGPKETTMFKKNGLRYWATDENAEKIGVPLKASSLYKKPTLKLLEERFRLNTFLRKPFKQLLAAKIDAAVVQAKTRDGFQAALKMAGIIVLFRENEEGRLYGITYVDSINKTVFNGSDLGKGYSAMALANRLLENQESLIVTSSLEKPFKNINNVPIIQKSGPGLLEELLSPTDQSGDQNLFERKKKKKRKKLRI